MPEWLSLVSVLAGQCPPDVSRQFRYVLLGCGDGSLATSVAAAHPRADVWAWDPRPSALEATRRCRDVGGVGNLTLYERATLLGAMIEPADFVVVCDVLVSASDERREQIWRAVGQALRPGGLLCVTYKTTVGWIEIAPVVALMRHMARRHGGDPDVVVSDIVTLLRRLRDGSAGQFSRRPAVAGWVDALLADDPCRHVRGYLAEDLRPLSHAKVREAAASLSCDYLGSARLIDELDLEVPEPLREMIAGAPTSVLREAFRDIAVRRPDRLDVFRLGSAPLSEADQTAHLVGLGLPTDRDQARLVLEHASVFGGVR